MALILCLETATDVCSVGLSHDGRLVALQESEQGRDHASQMTLLIGKCAEQAGYRLKDLDAVAVSSGPGSYTSLRIGWSTAKGIAYVLGIPLLSVDTLQALAWGAASRFQLETAWYCALIDARRMEVYAGVYEANGNRISGPEALVLDSGSFGYCLEGGRTAVFTGNGAVKFQPLCSEPNAVFIPLEASAAFLPALAEQAFQSGRFAEVAYSEPLYLKPPNITKPKSLI
ncbi:MAG: tRNA (adenosine(37)-N6)-threonylcarbamoyltransferase complex dimerization subunit type 1 TsaB [Haliscomenobacter sp.]|nr:tRNA (adenosine(37)-N6)-threonylcarbamoyltransferase complex dimerization subunit type 1 TsaB [Haliscomenobacter sp.]